MSVIKHGGPCGSRGSMPESGRFCVLFKVISGRDSTGLSGPNSRCRRATLLI